LQRLIPALSLLALLFLTGCVISPNLSGSNSPTGPTGTTGVGHLYVAEASSNQIVIFSNATADNGSNLTAVAIITGLQNPQRIFSDGANDRLYVANAGGPNILVFDSVSTLTGSANVTPTRTISYTGISSPTNLALDTNADVLYVADNGQIFAFPGASGLNGTVTSNFNIITPQFTPTGLFADSSVNTLFAANSAAGAVNAYTTASSLSGTPNAGTFNSLTGLNQPSGLEIDPAGRLLVSNTGSSSIDIYTNATQLSGDINATGIISGSPLSTPEQLAIDPTTNSGELYVADPGAGAIIVYTSITTATGNLAGATPSREISGLTDPTGVAIDTSH
jgi:6-phosphogluconolactonase (cycloisomerase 2 family)